MIQLYPIEVPGYLIPFLIKEMGGCEVISKDEEFTRLIVKPNSVLGMFLRRRILPDYKIKHYCLTIYSKKISNKKAFSTEIMEFQTSAEYRVDLSFDELESFYKFLDSNFKSCFYFFVKGYCTGSNSNAKIKEAIWKFIEHYELSEYGYDEKILRHYYYSFKSKGGLHKIFNNERIGDLFYGN
ncbi:hypothetical protein [Riemerella columbina]|uniref:hypothetical protein n=1 Tax=Riemerella columbina TaxID=103810 RepID=UPI0003682103|nr:hypothetical protein [Riemerella columbina]